MTMHSLNLSGAEILNAEKESLIERTVVFGYPISANRYWSATARGGRAITYVTSEAKRYREECAWAARMAGIHAPMQVRLAVTFDLYPKRPQDWQARIRKHGASWADTVQCIDVTNCEKVVCDALNGVVWEDDSQLWDVHLRKHEPDEHGPRLVMTVKPMVLL